MGKIFGREPAVITFVISNGIALAMAFGLQLSAEQVTIIMGFVNAVFMLIVRQSVSPTNGNTS